MTNPTIRVHNTETNEIIDREMTDDEFEKYQLKKAKVEANLAEVDAKVQAKAQLLEQLGITEEQAKLLLG